MNYEWNNQIGYIQRTRTIFRRIHKLFEWKNPVSPSGGKQQNEEEVGHSAFDKIIEYDIADIDNMIEALEKHYKEQQHLESTNIENLDLKSKKLLNLTFSFYSDKNNFYWEDFQIEIFDLLEFTKPYADKLRNDVKT